MGMERHYVKTLNRITRRIAAVASAAVLTAGLAACGGGGEPAASDDTPKVLKVGSATALTSLDPARSSTQAILFLTPVYESLIKRDAQGLLQPGLATEWELSDDATELELTLREGVTFHDGTPFDAEAVKANLDAAPDRGGQVTSQLSVVTGVEVVDDHQVRLSLSRPAADILAVLASEAGMMISPEALGSEDLGSNPVGTGPFTVAKNNQTGVVFEAWDGYWDKDSIQLDRLEFVLVDDDQVTLNGIITGELDMGVVRYPQIEEAEQRAPDTVVAATGRQAYVVGVMVNAAQGQWANPALRIAAQHAIDREGIATALYGEGGCEPVAQPFPTSYWASDPAVERSEAAAYDPDLARQIIEEAGLTGTPVKLYVGSLPIFQNMAAAVQEQLNGVGLDLTVESMDTAALSDARASGEFEASIASVQSGRPDPAQFVRQFYLPDGVFNFGGVVYEGVEEPLAAMQSTVDQDERAGYMHEIMKAVVEQGQLVIPICSETRVIMHQANIAGVEVPVNYDYDFTRVYFTD